MLTIFTHDITNIIFSYINYSYCNLVKIYKKRCDNPIRIINRTNILNLISKCCQLGYCGICVDGEPLENIEKLINHCKKYNNIIEYNVHTDGRKIVRLKNFTGKWIHMYCLMNTSIHKV